MVWEKRVVLHFCHLSAPKSHHRWQHPYKGQAPCLWEFCDTKGASREGAQRGAFLIPSGRSRGHLPCPAEIFRYLLLSHTLHHKTSVLPGMGRARSAAWPRRSVNNPERLVQGNSSCLFPQGCLQNMLFNLQFWDQGRTIIWD